MRTKILKSLSPVKYWETSIGRSRGSDVRLTNPMVSRDHAVLLRREAGWFVTDTGSKAGVTVNDKPITGRTAVYIGDRINIGGTILVVRRQMTMVIILRKNTVPKNPNRLKEQ